MRPKYDILWKGMIEEVIDDLLLFVEPCIGIIEQLAEIRHTEGVQKGIPQGKEESVRLFLINTEFPVKKIAELVGVSIAFVKKAKEMTQVI